jgi:Rhodopirellula transposase DDE domain
VQALIGLVEHDTAGDPMNQQKWTRKTTTALAEELTARGFPISADTVGRLLRQQRYSLKSNRKRISEGQDPDRDRQFRYLRRVRKLFVSKGLPVISVDTKKKELVGNFKNPGRRWRRQHRDVKDHDFPSKALGRAIPYGIYDWTHNDGYVVVGTSHETSAFAVAAIRRWWLKVGRDRYPTARALLIEADCGGGNDSRRWAWKLALQELADEFGLTILVTHYPPGASKWNPIEHRMFSLISIHWAAEPLLSYEVVLMLIRGTASATGFRCEAYLDETPYPTDAKVSKAQRATIRLERRPFLPRLNYVILPHDPPE